MIECHVCKRTPHDTALIRINEKGVTGIWACPDHTDKPMCEVTRIIHEDMENRKFGGRSWNKSSRIQ